MKHKYLLSAIILLSFTCLYAPASYSQTAAFELSSFSSKAQGRTVILNWSTVTEKNSNSFEIERSFVANESWIKVAKVMASNTSNSTKNYNYYDTQLQPGKYQYRLKMVDNNGVFTYSSVVTVELTGPSSWKLFQNYPNPYN